FGKTSSDYLYIRSGEGLALGNDASQYGALKIALGFGEGSPVDLDLRIRRVDHLSGQGRLRLAFSRIDRPQRDEFVYHRRCGIVDDLRQVEKDCGKSSDFRVAPEVFSISSFLCWAEADDDRRNLMSELGIAFTLR